MSETADARRAARARLTPEGRVFALAVDGEREARTRTIAIAVVLGLCVLGEIALAWAPVDGPGSVIASRLDGAILVLIPALFDAMRHAGRARAAAADAVASLRPPPANPADESNA